MNCVKELHLNTSVNRLASCVISACRKLNSLESVYAGFFVLFVPSVICTADRSNQLTYESIYNNTNYAQLQYLNRPYATPHISHNYQIHKTPNDTSWNEIDGTGTPIFVGFGRDPFRYSVPKDDYLRGVRHIDPRTYMNKKENRGKRGILHLANMLYCATGCDPVSYKGYGCYCGFLGAGRATDGIDRCCQLHDECYENIYCPFYTVYLQPYLWKCYRGQPLCALENFNSQYQFINGCAGRLCECDRKFAMCIRRYRCPQGRALCRSSPIRLLQNLLMFR